MFVVKLKEELDSGSTIVVDDELTLSKLDNFAYEEPKYATIEVSVTGTIIGATLSVEEMGGSRQLESEVDVIYVGLIEMIRRKWLLLNDDKGTNKEVNSSTVFFFFFFCFLRCSFRCCILMIWMMIRTMTWKMIRMMIWRMIRRRMPVLFVEVEVERFFLCFLQ